MKNFKGEIIIRPANPDKHTIENIGNSIHHQLTGIQDYEDDNIEIYLKKNRVLIKIHDCKNPVPDIVL